MAKVEMTRATKIALAAAHVLSFLTDDHEECNICGRVRERGHDQEYPCGVLQALLPTSIRRLT